MHYRAQKQNPGLLKEPHVSHGLTYGKRSKTQCQFLRDSYNQTAKTGRGQLPDTSQHLRDISGQPINPRYISLAWLTINRIRIRTTWPSS